MTLEDRFDQLVAALPGASTFQRVVVGGRPWHTLGICDIIAGVRLVETAADAQQFLHEYTCEIVRDKGIAYSEAERIAAANIGWVFGEGCLSREQLTMWRSIGVDHEIPHIEERTPMEMFEFGKQKAAEWLAQKTALAKATAVK